MGLGFGDHTLAVHLEEAYRYLSLPSQVRNPKKGLYSAAVQVDEICELRFQNYICETSNHPWDSGFEEFNEQIDLAKVVSSNLGVDLVWKPYETDNFLANFIANLIAVGLNFIPIVGTVLSMSFTVAWSAISNPEQFEADNVSAWPWISWERSSHRPWITMTTFRMVWLGANPRDPFRPEPRRLP